MLSQIMIAFTGVVAIALSQSTEFRIRKWASVFGLAGQPFWFHATFTAEQWGIFALCFLYLAVWMKGFYNHWIRV